MSNPGVGAPSQVPVRPLCKGAEHADHPVALVKGLGRAGEASLRSAVLVDHNIADVGGPDTPSNRRFVRQRGCSISDPVNGEARTEGVTSASILVRGVDLLEGWCGERGLLLASRRLSPGSSEGRWTWPCRPGRGRCPPLRTARRPMWTREPRHLGPPPSRARRSPASRCCGSTTASRRQRRRRQRVRQRATCRRCSEP